MNRNRRRYLKWSRKAREALVAGKDADKFLLMKWRYWHKIYRQKRLWE